MVVDDLVGDDRKTSSHRVEVGVAEDDGIAAPAIEVLEVETGIAIAEEIAPEPEAGCQGILGVGLTAHPHQVGNVVAVTRSGPSPDEL